MTESYAPIATNATWLSTEPALSTRHVSMLRSLPNSNRIDLRGCEKPAWWPIGHGLARKQRALRSNEEAIDVRRLRDAPCNVIASLSSSTVSCRLITQPAGFKPGFSFRRNFDSLNTCGCLQGLFWRIARLDCSTLSQRTSIFFSRHAYPMYLGYTQNINVLFGKKEANGK